MRTRLNVYFPPELARQIDELAIRRRISRSAIVEAAVASYLSSDGADRMEAAFARRLDRLSRQIQRLERNTGLSTEALALFVRFWLRDAAATRRGSGSCAGERTQALRGFHRNAGAALCEWQEFARRDSRGYWSAALA